MMMIAAKKAAVNKIAKYGELANTHICFPVAIETAGARNHLAIELVQEIGRRITAVTEEPRESMFLFQRLSVALQRGNAVEYVGFSEPTTKNLNKDIPILSEAQYRLGSLVLAV